MAVLAALLIGGAAGYRLGRTEAPAAVTVQAKPETKAAPGLKNLAGQSPAASRPPTVPEREAGAKSPDKFGMLLAIQEMGKTGQASLNVTVFDSDGNLSTAVKRLLDIDDAQAAALNGALLTVRQQASDLAVRLATVQPDGEHGGLVITIPSFPEEGGKIYDQMLAQSRAVLGQDRTNILMSLFSNQYGDNNPANIGLETRTITVGHKEVLDNSGNSRVFFTFKEERALMNLMVNGKLSAGATSTSQGSATDRKQLVQALGAVGAKLIPPDF